MRAFHRNILKFLHSWRCKPHRKPLILRGARQVGKSYAVRQFARENFKHLLEVNFEQTPEVASILTRNSPKRAAQLLEVQYGIPVIAGETLLFLDEVQSAPEVLASLRYLFEELPALHVIAAGSLLDFTLMEHDLSVPVGRVEYAYLGPATFSEFLSAVGEDSLLGYLQNFTLQQDTAETMPEALHLKALQLVRTFMLIGGMPEAVASYATTGSLSSVEEIKRALFTSFRDDFSKYRRRVDVAALKKVFERVPRLVGTRIKYVEIDREMRSKKIADTLDLLTYARLLTKVRHSSCNGIPLGAEANESIFKLLFLDVGLLTTACQITPSELEAASELNLVNRGSLAEQFIGQHLLYRGAPSEEPALYFWHREARNASAEIDYVVSHDGTLLPIEVKATKGGALRSLHYFMAQKRSPIGIKFDSQPPRLIRGTATLAGGSELPYTLISLPHYLVDDALRIVAHYLQETR